MADGRDGPDGSSLKPVSSLRSHFENMGKGPDQSSGSGSPVPTRAASPVHKPDRPREPPAHVHEAPPPPRAKPPARIPSAPNPEPHLNSRAVPPPRLSPSPANVGAPSLHVQPPRSPPRGRSLRIATGDLAGGFAGSFLNPDSLVKPSTPATPSRPFKIPSSTPHTPVFEPRRSPRLVPSQPPSPPPPRRSAELKRERERDRDVKPVPPPINRADKPLIPARLSYLGSDTSLNSPDFARRFVETKSPFGSPPSSNGSVDEDPPPTLPARPKPAGTPTADDIPRRGSAIQVEFDPPPLHPSIASRRKEREHDMANGAALRVVGGAGASRGPLTPQGTGDQGPPLPTRPGAPPQEQKQPAPTHNGYSVMRPPPRPPKSGANDSQIPAAQKRAVSTPTSQQHPPPPQRAHGRTTTLDRSTSLRAPPPPPPPPGPPAMPAVSENRVPESPAGSGARTEINLAYPDSSNTNRRPPFIKQGVHEIHTKYDSRIFDVCGELVCTSGHLTRVWSVLDGELLMSLSHGENVKATAVAFRPGANVDEEGARVWIGNNVGELMEADIATQSIVASKPAAHGRHEIIKIYRHFNELWTLDEAGTLNVWGPDEETGVPNMAGPPHQAFRCPKGHTFSIVVGDELWHATGKEVRIFLPTMDGRNQFQVLIRALYQEQAGDVVSGTLMPSDPDKVFLGHGDGKVSIYSRADYSCVGLFNISSFKVNTLAGVGDHIWAGFNSGRLCVYDITQSPWVVKKDWQAHDNPVVKLIPDRSSFWKTERSQVISLGADSMIRAWDGLLQEDWLEDKMQSKDGEYCQMEQLKAMIMTWNAGASTPNSLRYSDSDATFIQQLLQSSDSPDILVFGFQELVDLEDKTATAKRFLKTKKKKEGSDQERMSHQYRDWRDFLVRSLDDYMPGELYHLLQTAHMVGLFTCIFVKADIRDRIRNLSAAEVKRGMGGLHGNKGAIVVRFTLDDTSLCFVNCHLAAGQTQAQSRHNDIHAILEAAILPVERDPNTRIDNFIGGGDGTMILDHELCLINGDLNYRIDTMSRDTVVMAVKAGNLAKLLERDQLLVARRRNPAFRLRAFEEAAISFAPTYKYDVGTDNYDSSEKKRSPAWCDRLLHRGARGRITQLDYRRHEVRVSDHRPVSGRFRFSVKHIEPRARAVAWMECQQRFEDTKAQVAMEEKLYYLMQIIGYDEVTSHQLITERSSRRVHRSPSRNRG
ncbi:skeletal muscle and kidney-enriched inositol phosphatase [Gaeumannomyces tritici R3-111a-1]|uniref:Skeletal muscle and kidney-enriched inositol phosphatase n=1 Tax=Gaeumannomyces tritici (strain R3-111a-1) TaxID=644352 RepID=J3P343_GAET3|nr:skeletal muscle and kidney-enriched inositol phosphatase [Gaeumannomyces tritici R3-111a-1]EJT74085.1 skeletal muscle and kidney-enriched inositol phosphatase [Gaeumannomyces tritici R3-111a-1]